MAIHDQLNRNGVSILQLRVMIEKFSASVCVGGCCMVGCKTGNDLAERLCKCARQTMSVDTVLFVP